MGAAMYHMIWSSARLPRGGSAWFARFEVARAGRKEEEAEGEGEGGPAFFLLRNHNAVVFHPSFPLMAARLVHHCKQTNRFCFLHSPYSLLSNCYKI